MQKITLVDVLRKKNLKDRGFDIQDGWTVEVKETATGSTVKQLANFVAWPVSEIQIDDGTSMSRYYDVQGIMSSGKVLPQIRLTHSEFLGDLHKTLSKYWGMDIIIKPRAKDALREAMQVLGRTRKVENVYTYTGWREINGRLVFLHAGGAVGAENVKVDLSEGGEVLGRYSLPARCESLEEAANTVFSLFSIANPEIIYPLFASVFLAPLCEVLRPRSLEPDFMIFLIGRTQSGKSSLASLFLSFFGDFDKNHFPANYRQTPSSLERISFLLKDVMMVVDDYYPAQSHQEREKMKEMAQRLARAYGDGAVRMRMSGNKLQKSWPPRGLAISTGEERPEIGESGQGRFVFIDVNREDVNYEALMTLQQDYKEQLAAFMIMYLEWIAVNWERIPELFNDSYQKAKQIFVSDAYSGRINESIPKMCGGMEVVLSFAKEHGLISEVEYSRHGEIAVAAFQQVLEQNVSSLVAEKPSQKFLTALTEIISADQVRLCSVDAEVVPDKHVGCYDESSVYLLPGPCYQAVKKYYSLQGQTFPVGDKTLWRHLRGEGIIEHSENRGRNTIQKWLPCLKSKPDVLIMNKSYLGL